VIAFSPRGSRPAQAIDLNDFSVFPYAYLFSDICACRQVRGNARKNRLPTMRWRRGGSPVSDDGRGLKLSMDGVV
jgi:hypothetical protein